MAAMNGATISTKGQLVIPHRFRKALHLQAGDKVSFSLKGERLFIGRQQPRRARLVRGQFGRPVLVAPPGAPPMTPERVRNILGRSARTPLIEKRRPLDFTFPKVQHGLAFWAERNR